MTLKNLRTGLTVRQERLVTRPLPALADLPLVIIGHNRRINTRLQADITDWSAAVTVQSIPFPNYGGGYVSPDKVSVYARNSYGTALLSDIYYTLEHVGNDAGVTGSPSVTIEGGTDATFTLTSGATGTYQADSDSFTQGTFFDENADFVVSRVSRGDKILRNGVPTWVVAAVTSDKSLLVYPIGRGPESVGDRGASRLAISAKNPSTQSRVITALDSGFSQAGGWGTSGTKAQVGDLVEVDNWVNKSLGGGLVYEPAGFREGTFFDSVTVTATQRVVTFPKTTDGGTYTSMTDSLDMIGAVIFTKNSDDVFVPTFYATGAVVADRDYLVGTYDDSPVSLTDFSSTGVSYSLVNYAAVITSGATGRFSAKNTSTLQRIFTDATGDMASVTAGDHIAILGADDVYRPVFEVVSKDGETLTVTDLDPNYLSAGYFGSNVKYNIATPADLDESSTANVTVALSSVSDSILHSLNTSTSTVRNYFGGHTFLPTDRILYGSVSGAKASLTVKFPAVIGSLGNTVFTVSDGSNTVSYRFFDSQEAADVSTAEFRPLVYETATDGEDLAVQVKAAIETELTHAGVTFPALNLSCVATGSASIGTLVMTADYVGIQGNASYFLDTTGVGYITDSVNVALTDGVRYYFTGGAGTDFNAEGVAIGDLIFNDRGVLLYEVTAIPTNSAHYHELVVKQHEQCGITLLPGDSQTNLSFSVRDTAPVEFAVRRVISPTELEVIDIPTSPNSIPDTTSVLGSIRFIDAADGIQPASLIPGGSLSNVNYGVTKTLSGADLTGDILISYVETRGDFVTLREVSIDEYQTLLGDAVPENPVAMAASIAFSITSAPIYVSQVAGEDTEAWQAAIQNLQTDAVYSIVPLTQDPIIEALFQDHVNSESAPDVKRERILWQSHKFEVEQVKATKSDDVEAYVSKTSGGVTTAVVYENLIAKGVALGDNFFATAFDGTTTTDFDARILSIEVAGSTTTLGLVAPDEIANGTEDLALVAITIKARPQTLAEQRDEVADYLVALSNRRIRNIFPYTVEMRTDYVDLDGVTKQQITEEGAFFMCVGEAAKRMVFGGTAPLTRRPSGGIYRILDPFGDRGAYHDVIIDSGGYYMVQIGGPGSSVETLRALTTDVTDLTNAEESVTSAIDTFVRSLRNQLDPLLGPEIMDNRFFDMISVQTQAVIDATIANKGLKTVSITSLEESPDTPDTFIMKLSATPYFSGARGDITLYF